MKHNKPKSFSTKIAFIYEAVEKGKSEAMAAMGVSEEEAQAWLDWFENEDRSYAVFHEHRARVTKLNEVEETTGETLESLPLVINKTMNVAFEKSVYRIDKPGVYRFMVIPHKIQNVVYYESLLDLLCSISTLQVHCYHHMGDSTEKHKGATAEKLEKYRHIMQNEAWVGITCGHTTDLGMTILNNLGFKTRKVSALTLENWNTYANGHVLLEVYFEDEGWVLVDIDQGVMFRDNGKFLSAYAIWKMVKNNEAPEFYVLANKLWDPFFKSESGFSYTAYYMWQWDKPDLWAMFRRVFQSFGFHDDGAILWLGPETRIREYLGEEALVVDESAFVKKFYTNNSPTFR